MIFFRSELHVLIHSAFFVGIVVVAAAGLVWPFVQQGQPLNKFKSYEAHISRFSSLGDHHQLVLLQHHHHCYIYVRTLDLQSRYHLPI